MVMCLALAAGLVLVAVLMRLVRIGLVLLFIGLVAVVATGHAAEVTHLSRLLSMPTL
jgi:hypothetical protein